MAAIGDARCSRVRGRAAVGSEEGDLAAIPALVRLDELGESVPGDRPAASRLSPFSP